MRKKLAACVYALLSAGFAASAQAQPLGDLLACAEPFGKDASEASLKTAFGAQNVVSGDVDIGEGATDPGTIVFPNDPARRIEILWDNRVDRRRPHSIAPTGTSRWSVSATPQDRRRIRLGTTLPEVEAINGRPFRLNGFGWANGGSVVDWNGGVLGARRPCRIEIRFDIDPKTRAGLARAVSGGRRFTSSDAAIRAVMPSVSAITLYWPE